MNNLVCCASVWSIHVPFLSIFYINVLIFLFLPVRYQFWDLFDLGHSHLLLWVFCLFNVASHLLFSTFTLWSLIVTFYLVISVFILIKQLFGEHLPLYLCISFFNFCIYTTIIEHVPSKQFHLSYCGRHCLFLACTNMLDTGRWIFNSTHSPLDQHARLERSYGIVLDAKTRSQ